MSLLDLARTTPPAEPLLSLADAKAQMGIEHEDHDALIAGLVESVTDHLEGYSGYLGRVLVEQTWTLHLAAFPHGRFIQLPMPPLISVGGVTYVDGLGATRTLAPASYHVLTGELARIQLADGQSWPSTSTHPRAVTVTFTCGYGAAAAVPRAIRQAALLMVADLYKNRESGVEGTISSQLSMPTTVENLLRPRRIIHV